MGQEFPGMPTNPLYTVCVCMTALLPGFPRLCVSVRNAACCPGCHSYLRNFSVHSHPHQMCTSLLLVQELAEGTQAAVCEILHTGPRACGCRRPHSRCSTGAMTAATFSSVHNPATRRYTAFLLPWQPPGMHGR